MPPENVPSRLPLTRISVEVPPNPRSDAVWLLNVVAPMTLPSDTLPSAVVGRDEIHDLHRVGRAAAVDLAAVDDLHRQRAFAFDALDVRARHLDPDVLRQRRAARACEKCGDGAGDRQPPVPDVRGLHTVIPPEGCDAALFGQRCRCTRRRLRYEAYEARASASQSVVGQRGTRAGERRNGRGESAGARNASGGDGACPARASHAESIAACRLRPGVSGAGSACAGGSAWRFEGACAGSSRKKENAEARAPRRLGVPAGGVPRGFGTHCTISGSMRAVRGRLADRAWAAANRVDTRANRRGGAEARRPLAAGGCLALSLYVHTNAPTLHETAGFAATPR